MTVIATHTGIEVHRKALLVALERVGRIVPTRNPKPILTGVRLEAGGGALRLQATDLDVSITATVPCDGELPATIVVAKELLARVKLGKAEGCSLAYDDEQSALMVNGGRVEHVLPTLPAEEFPPSQLQPSGQRLCIRCDELKPAIRMCLAAVAKESTRYALNAILLESDTNGVRLVATDGRRLAECSLDSVEGDYCGQVLIPGKLARLLCKLADAKHQDAVAFHVENRTAESGEAKPARIAVCGHGWQVVTDAAEGTFPRYRDVIPESGSRFVVDRKALVGLLAEVAQATNFESKGVQLDLSADGMRVSAESPGNGASAGNIPATFDGGGDDRIVIAFNPAFLLDAAKSLDAPQIVLDVQQNRPGTIKNGVISGPGLLYEAPHPKSRWLIMSVHLGLPASPETLGSNYVEEVAA